MARQIPTPSSGGLVGPFEPLVFQTLLQSLPASYAVAPNFQLKQKGTPAYEYDFIVLAPHAVYVIEAKEWYGRLSGDDSEWLLNDKPKKCPLWLVNSKCKVLRSELGALAQHVWVTPVLVLPDGTQNHVGGSWGSNVRSLTGLVSFLQDPSKVTKPGNIAVHLPSIEKLLQGKWGARWRAERQRFGSYQVTETLAQDARGGEYLARHALVEDDPADYRIRTFRLDPHLTPDEQKKQRAVFLRPAEALAKIGPHPNLLRVLQFDFLEDDFAFFEVTEWSELGTLHGYLSNPDRERLTIRQRLEVAEGVAAALEAVHAHDVVHRNLCPETIVLGFGRVPRLTDFDRAFVEGKQTVFVATDDRKKNTAYLAPELGDITEYEFGSASDMYSFGVLLYHLLTDQLPFEGPADAKARAGTPEKVPSALREGVDVSLDHLVLKLLRTDDFNARPAATEARAVLRSALGGTTGTGTGRSGSPSEPPGDTFEVGTLLKGVMRIDARLGTGGFGHVLKVFHLDHQRTYALKVLHKVEDAELMLREFNLVRPYLPVHPNIAKIEWMDRLDPPARLPYLLMELVEGETLEPYCDGRKTLPWTDIRRIGVELLGALAAIHPDAEEFERRSKEARGKELDEAEYDALQAAREKALRGLAHRDIKPPNILLEMPSHRVKIIDFNIAEVVGAPLVRARTPHYAPADGDVCSGASFDLFSVGVVLYELVAHRHPYPERSPGKADPYDPREIVTECRVSDSLATFLLRAVGATAAERYGSAKEMRAALEAVPSMVAPASLPPVPPGQYPGITVPPEEARRENYNPYVTRLLTLYSQARRTNAGTRGLDEIAQLTYVRTRLDDNLGPAIMGGGLRLVIVTGNAGDGKTAFVQRVESAFRKAGAPIEVLPSGNGSRWEFQGVWFETNYDGSQDEGDRTNDDVLARFFEPFRGSALSGLHGDECRIVAINEGRLLDFLSHGPMAAELTGLKGFVLETLAGGAQPEGALLVNLNLRAVTAGGAESLVERQLKEMLRGEIWAPCEGCAHEARCPIKHNADTLRDAASGAAVQERIRRLFEIAHLRRRAHITMRDLRSALSYLLLRDKGCDDVAELLSRDDEELSEDLAILYYPNAFAEPAAAAARGGDPADERAVDRLVRRLREADVGLVNAPALDRRLDHDPSAAVPWMTFEARAGHGLSVMKAVFRDTPRPGAELPVEDVFRARRRTIAMFRRWAYFERRDDGWRDMLPYRSLGVLERLVEATEPASRAAACQVLRDEVVEAVSRAEGLRDTELRTKYLALRVTRSADAPLRSFRLFPREDFRIELARPPAVGDYLEHAPDAVELVAEGDAARLRISLDLLEMLELIRAGYRPTTGDLQGLFVNLLIFRNELLTRTFDRVLVTEDDHEFYEISAQGAPSGISLVLQKRLAEGGEGHTP